jgi:peroxiredoxin
MRRVSILVTQWLAALLLLSWAAAQAAEMTPGSQAPEFTLKSLKDKNLSLREFRGQVVMINFWATWCGPCRQEMPALNALYEKYRSAGFVLLGVDVDAESGSAAQMAGKLKVTYPILFDTEKKASALYLVSAMPTTVLIDRSGKVRYVQKGYLAGYEDKYQTQVRELLKE